jgi:ABC-type transport system involved in multi-copper enzyme maturation permease subunit
VPVPTQYFLSLLYTIMATALISFVWRSLSPTWLTGPIFDKELRVSSRRRRNYFLRFAYIGLLSFFVVFVWFTAVTIGGAGSAVFRASRMSEAGKYITTSIVWFQFITVQLIAVIMLSASISDEIHHRTLGLLMTTPISSFQIVMGKLFSKLLQLILLLAISLPLLAIIRVFGGVPWDYVISSLCITITAAIFAGSISLFFSIYTKRAHSVVIKTICACFALYAVLPGLVRLLSFTYGFFGVPNFLLFYINPFAVMMFNTQRAIYPSMGTFPLSWLAHCAIMTGGSAVLLGLSTLSVRRVGLRQATGQAGIFSSRKERRITDKKRAARADSAAISGRCRSVKGPPVIWKQMIIPLVKGSRLTIIITYVLLIIILLAVYGYCAYEKVFGFRGVQIAFVLAYFFLGLLRTATITASSITSEREARTWPILLATPLDESQIVLGKIIGSCLQCWPFWLLLSAHVFVFTLAGCIHPLAIVPLALLVSCSAVLVSAVGVFFSSCFKRTTPAAAINLTLFILFTLPSCCPMPTYLISPLFAASTILSVTWGKPGMMNPFYGGGPMWFSWIGAFLISEVALVVLITIYLLFAFLAFAIAKSNVRHRIS